MNNRRRRKLRIAMHGLSTVMVLLTKIAAEEEDSFFNLPEPLQESEMGEQMESNIDLLNQYIEAIEEFLEEMEYM